MANSPDYHAKLIIGDLVLTIARLSADNEALRENQKPGKKQPRPVLASAKERQP